MRSCPYELEAYDKAFLMQRQIRDEDNWILGQYVMSAFGTVMSQAFSKHSHAKYIQEPMMKGLSNNNSDDSEANEILAMTEMMKFAEVMRLQGLPETEIIS